MSDNQRNKPVNQTTSVTQYSREPSFWQEVWEQVRLVYYLIRDPEVPLYLKIVPFLAFVYLLMPLDILPDWVLGLGQFDDLTVMLVGAKVFIELSPQDTVARHITAMRARRGYVSNEGNASAVEFDDDPDIVEGIVIEENDPSDV